MDSFQGRFMAAVAVLVLSGLIYIVTNLAAWGIITPPWDISALASLAILDGVAAIQVITG
jgi:hypothetical protein